MHWLLEGRHWFVIVFAWCVSFALCWSIVLVGASAERAGESEPTEVATPPAAARLTTAS
jgi:hypothetical protein